MKVILGMVEWSGDHAAFVEDGDDVVLLSTYLSVDGEIVKAGSLGPQFLIHGGDFLMLEVKFRRDPPDNYDSLSEEDQRWDDDSRDSDEAEIREWASQFGPAQWLMGTDEEKILLPVTSLKILIQPRQRRGRLHQKIGRIDQL